MSIEDKLFDKYIVEKNKLIEYGFEMKEDKLVFELNLSKKDFKVVIEYDEKISGKIFDLSTGYEYTNYRIENTGGFSSEVREEFISVLKNIRNNCSHKQLFKSKQALNINAYIKEKYDDLPEFLWEKLPTYAVYRKKKNNKWYAVVGTVGLNKLNPDINSNEVVEIINVKVDKDEIKSLLVKNGIYEAYHMNKKNWVSIILDGTIKDFEINQLVAESYDNV